MGAIETAAQQLGLRVLTVPVRAPEDLHGTFTMMVRERVNGFLTVGIAAHALAACPSR
jgi:hypothetical protein